MSHLLVRTLGHPLLQRWIVRGYIVGKTLQLLALRLTNQAPLLVLFRAGGIGDIVATAPSVAVLRALHPTHHLVFCTRPEFSALAAVIPGVDSVVSTFYGDDLWAFITRWFDARRFRYRDEYDPAGSFAHFSREMAASAGVELPADSTAQLAVEVATDAELTAWFGPALVGHRFIALHAGPSAPVREWPLTHWQTLTAALTADTDCAIVQIGSGRHFLHGEKDTTISGALQPQQALSLLDSARLLRRCALFIGIDSGPLHLAAAVGVPAIGLFGPVDPALRLPTGAHAVVTESVLDCQFCHHHLPRGHWETGCPRDMACLSSLALGTVLRQALSLLHPEQRYDG